MATEPSGPREVRVFVSSTFKDMLEDRDELNWRVFPALRRQCENRGIAWADVDLRWGVTDEQRAEGQVLPICLSEIERCQPFFIGLLGERYGWVPAALEPGLMARFPWLDRYQGRSVTEIEIAFAIFERDGDLGDAYFYFRDPSYADARPADQGDFRDGDDERRERLAGLKDRIRRSGATVREGYRDPEELGKWVLADLETAIARRFPGHGLLDTMVQEALRHEGFETARRRSHVGRADMLRMLDAAVLGKGPPVALTGGPGTGKSALLAAWVAAWRVRHPGDIVVSHYVEASGSGSDWSALVTHVLSDLERQSGQEIPRPHSPKGLRDALAVWLNRASGKRRVVLVIDGVDRLEEAGGGADLVWLPLTIPKRVRLILSGDEGRALTAIARRDWTVVTLPPLPPAERKAVVVATLAVFGKTLADRLADRLAGHPLGGNPLFLWTCAEVLRFHGDHETLEQRLDALLAAYSLPSLFDQVISGWENEFDNDRPRLVADALSAIWAAQDGLTEGELRDLLGDGTAPIPQWQWSPFHVVASEFLTSRSGRVAFFGRDFREAVRLRYLRDDGVRLAMHGRLAAYFEGRPADFRRQRELPYQLLAMGQWAELASFLSCDEALLGPAALHEIELQRFWAFMNRAAAIDMAAAYAPLIRRAGEFTPEMLCRIGGLLGSSGHHVEAGDAYLAALAQALPRLGAMPRGSARPGDPATLLLALKSCDPSLDRQSAVSASEAALGLAQLLTAAEQHRDALGILELQEILAKRLDDIPALAASLGAQATAQIQRFKQIIEELPTGVRGLAITAQIDDHSSDVNAALVKLQEMERLCRANPGLDHLLADCLGMQAWVLSQLGWYKRALTLDREAERLFRHVGDNHGLAVCLSRQARSHARLRRPEPARRLLEAARAVARESGLEGLLAQFGEVGAIVAEAEQATQPGFFARLLGSRPRQ